MRESRSHGEGKEEKREGEREKGRKEEAGEKLV